MTENVVFVLAGRDQSGMWNLIFNEITERTVMLTEVMTAKFEEVTVLAVNSEGLVDKVSLEIDHDECSNDIENIEENSSEEKVFISSFPVSRTNLTLYFISLILILLISIIIIRSRLNKKLSLYDDSVGDITKDAFLTSKDDFEFGGVDNDHLFYKFF